MPPAASPAVLLPAGSCPLDSEHPAALQQRQLRADDFPTGVDQFRVEVGGLTGGRRQVPAVDEDIDEAMAGVDRPGNGPVRNGARAVERAGSLEGSRLRTRRNGRRRRVDPCRARRRRASIRRRQWCGRVPSSAAHRLPVTMWLTSSCTVQPSHGVGNLHWSALTAATKSRTSSRVRRCNAAISMVPIITPSPVRDKPS